MLLLAESTKIIYNLIGIELRVLRARSSVWLERLLCKQEAGCSNHPESTTFLVVEASPVQVLCS